ASLKMQHDSMEALQQRVVQITRDTCSLADALFQAHVELLRQLPQPQLVQPPQQCHKSGHAHHAEPPSTPPRGKNMDVKGDARLVPHAAVVAALHAKDVIARGQRRVGYETLFAAYF